MPQSFTSCIGANTGQFSEPINISSAQKYYKLICNQDLDRTPSIGKNVAEDFFNLNLRHGQSIKVIFSFKYKKFEVEINKRKTRNEYRFFINRVRSVIEFDIDDILVITQINNVFDIELLKKHSIANQSSGYDMALSKMDGKLHVLSS